MKTMVDKLSVNPPSSPLTLPKGGAERSSPQSGLMQLLTSALGRSPDSAVSARVDSVAPATAEQRQQLISRLIDTLLMWQSKPDSANKNQQLARLADEQQLLNSSLLKLVRLNVQQQSVVTYTDRPLKPGQQVAVYLSENKLWQLANPRTADTGTATGARPGLPDTTPLLVAEALRRTLPLKDKPDLGPVLPQIQNLSYHQQRELFASSLQQALRQAAHQLREPAQLSQPGALRQALADGGVFLERKLTEALRPPVADPKNTASRSDATLTANVGRVLTSDWKASVLTILQQARTELSRLGQSPEPQRAAELNLGPLIQELAARPAPELADRTLRTQLLQMVHQLALHSLARVQNQQSQTLGQQFAQAETGQPAQSLSLEVPMRLGQEVHPLLLHIEPEPEQEEKKRQAGKLRQWQVQLSFELPGAGPLYAQLTVRDQQVATRLWAEKPHTAERIKAQLTDLQQRMEKDGIEVTQLECHAGAPPRPMNNIQYSLVDITT